ncbi:hypothetical protein EC890511_4852, partial [Escherichia coli 89.0511]
MTLYFLLI